MSVSRRAISLANRMLRPLGAELASPAELDRLRGGRVIAGPEPSAAPLPTGAADHLRIDNPRLTELMQRYAAMPDAVTSSSVWTAEYIAQEVDLPSFRGDNAYVWQARDHNTEANHLLTAYYLESIDRLGLLDQLHDDALFGALGFTWKDDRIVTRDLLDSVAEIDFIETEVGLSGRDDVHVLDIGAGYGRMAQRLVEAFEGVTVHATDALAVSTFLCEFNLGFRGVTPRASAVPLDEIDALLQRQPIDLATNIHSFSEAPLSSVNWWLDLLREHEVPQLMIIPNADDHDGHRVTAREATGLVDLMPELSRRDYHLTVKRPKFADPAVQRIGVSPSQHHIFELRR